MQDFTQLHPHQILVDRPFADPDHIATDSATLLTTAKNSWHIAEQSAYTANPSGTNPNAPLTIHHPNSEIWQKRTLLLNPAAMLAENSLTVVGFFGIKRPHIEPHIEADIQQAGQQLCQILHEQSEIICYASRLLADGYNYANLVVMNSQQAIDNWGKHEVHQWVAQKTSPHYYANVRIYSGNLQISHPQRLFSLNLSCVKYFDFTSGQVWKAVRYLDEPTANDVSTAGEVPNEASCEVMQ